MSWLNLHSTGLFRAAFLVVGSITISSVGYAQSLDVEDVQKNVDIFASVLEEALDLNEASGLFGISLGGIDSTYLYGQGVVFEIRTPLSSRRNTLGLASLTSTLQNMQARSNPFAALAQSERAQSASPQAFAESIASDAQTFYESMMDRISNVDYSLRFNTAIQQASDYARSLRSMDSLDESAYETLRQDLDAMRQEMQIEFAKLREIEQQVSESAASSVNQLAQTDLQDSLDAVLAKLEPLRDRAVATAEELRERSQRAEQEYAADWLRQVQEFETGLYAVMCSYGATLQALPADESVSIILTGLGEDVEDGRRTDKIHVYSKADLLACQNGSMDEQELQVRTISYSY